VHWLESHLSARVRVRLDDRSLLPEAYKALLESMMRSRCKVKSSMMVDAKKQIVALIHFPSGLDPKAMESDLLAAMPRGGQGCEVDVEVE
jgi:hypothetical protein